VNSARFVIQSSESDKDRISTAAHGPQTRPSAAKSAEPSTRAKHGAGCGWARGARDPTEYSSSRLKVLRLPVLPALQGALKAGDDFEDFDG
jgi:hypothetical protein